MSKPGEKRALEKEAIDVTGPHQVSTPAGAKEWLLKITYSDGQKTTRGTKTKSEAIALKKQIKQEMALQQQVKALGRDVGEWDGTLFWVERVIVQMMQDVYREPWDESNRKALTALASAGKTVKVLHDVSEMAEQMKRMEEQLYEILAASQHGTRTSGQADSPTTSA
jgi:hypothetical protein